MRLKTSIRFNKQALIHKKFPMRHPMPPQEKARTEFGLKTKLKAAIFAAIMLSCGSACPDKIYFKDGGMAEGAIRQEYDKSVIIDLGIGTMSVRKDEIDRIEKASLEESERLERERRAGEITREGRAPFGCEGIRMAYLKAKESREALKRAKKNSISYKDEILREENTISELLGILDKKGRELKTIDSDKHVKEYNAVAAEMNSISARLNTENRRLKDLYAEEEQAAGIKADKANKYRADFQVFKDELYKKRHSEACGEMQDDEVSFFEEISAKMAGMEIDFKKDLTDYTSEDNQIIVDAVIDGRAFARLVVDTGASIVVISKNIADRLDIIEQGIDAEMLIMADGTSVGARPVILKSVKVGAAEVKNVQAAILESGVIGGVDGLLGMSFLSNFVVSVDTSANKLILEQVL